MSGPEMRTWLITFRVLVREEGPADAIIAVQDEMPMNVIKFDVESIECIGQEMEFPA